MKRFFLILILLLFTFAAHAQKDNKAKSKIPDFTGTWILDKERTDVEGGKGSIEMSVDIKMVIEHNESKMKITQTVKQPDGTETVENNTIFIDGKRRSVFGKRDAKNFVMYNWKGKTFVKTAKYIIKRDPPRNWNPAYFRNETVVENREEWKISKDGKTLMQRLIDEAPNDNPIPFSPVTIFVFRRQD